MNTDRTREAALKGYSNASRASGLRLWPKACHSVILIILSVKPWFYAIEKEKALEDLTIPEFRQFSDVVGDDVYDILSLQSCLDKRCAKGGVSPLRVAEAIAEAKRD